MKLTLYMKPDCHLCEDALVQLRAMATRDALEIETVDISKDARLMSTYGLRIPVVRIGDRELDAPLTRGDIERALNDEARRQRAEGQHALGEPRRSDQQRDAELRVEPAPHEPTPGKQARKGQIAR